MASQTTETTLTTQHGIVFDLDGTLIDSGLDLANSVNHMLRQMNRPERDIEEVKSFVGDGVKKLIERSLGQSHNALVNTGHAIFTSHYYDHCTDNTDLYPGIEEMLQTLKQKGCKLAVLTNKPYDFSIKILEVLNIVEYFECIIGGDSVGVKKPNPLTLEHIGQSMDLPVTDLIMVGDHIADIETAHACGSKIIYCEYGIGRRDDLSVDASIKQPKEIIELIDSISNL